MAGPGFVESGFGSRPGAWLQPARPLALPPGCSARPEVAPSGWQAMADPSGSARPTTYTDLAVARGLIPSRSPVADSIPRPGLLLVRNVVSQIRNRNASFIVNRRPTLPPARTSSPIAPAQN